MKAGIYMLLCVNVWLFLLANSASAHAVNSGYSQVSMDNKRVHFEMMLSQSLFLKYDTDGDGGISEHELALQKGKIQTYIDLHLELFNQDTKLQLIQLTVTPTMNESIPELAFKMEYASDLKVDQLRVHYSMFINDTDPRHQNFLTFYKGNEVIGQTVLEKGHDTYELRSNKPALYTSFLWTYGMLGGQMIVEGAGPLLFLLCMAMRAIPLDKAMNSVLIMVIAHAAIVLTSFRFGLAALPVSQIWLEIAAWAIICSLALGNFIRTTSGKFFISMAAAYGLLHGFEAMKGNHPISHAERFSQIIVYHIGALTVMLIVLYMLYHLIHFFYKKTSYKANSRMSDSK